MSKQFNPSQFKSGQYTAEEKAKFANHFARFLLAGCPWSLFHKWFYQRLSYTFSHIAHYDRHGFYATWFADDEKRRDFLRHTLAYPCYGQPEYTFCDVERALQSWYAERQNEVDQAFDQRKTEEEKDANSEESRLADLQEATEQQFCIAAKSKATQSFGHYGYIVVAKDGSAFEINIIPSNRNHEIGDVITTPLRGGRPTWQGLYVEAPRRLKNADDDTVEKVWGEVTAR